MALNLENKTREYPRIRFIDRALRKGEETHYRCIECGQYVVGDLRHTHKCRITILPLDINIKVKYIEARRDYLKLRYEFKRDRRNLKIN